MKKLLIMLMVVAMASFLFVGCLGGGVTPPVDDEDEDGVTPPTTVPPIITSVPDIVGGYINAAAAADGLVVNGTAPTYSEVKVYINGITAGTGDAGVNGVFSVVVANADLIKAVKVEGAKTLHATATDLGLPESASSNVKNFILDTIIPFIASSVAKAGTGRVYSVAETADTMTLFSPALRVNVSGTGTVYTPVAGTSAAITTPFTAIPATAFQLLAGTVNWKIEVIAFTFGDSTTTVRVTNITAGTAQDYTYDNTAIIVSTSWIPGAIITTARIFTSTTDVGAYVLMTTTNTALSAGYVDVTFNEAVTGASIISGAWTLFRATTAVPNTRSVRSATVARLTETVAGMLTTGMFYSVGVSGIADLAGNTIPATAPSSDSGVIIP